MMLTFGQFIIESGYHLVLFGHHPKHGVKSVRVADIPDNQSTAHEAWFHRMGWPSAGDAYDKIPRGEAEVHPSHVKVRMSSKHKFASNEVINHLKTKYNLHNHQFRDGPSIQESLNESEDWKRGWMSPKGVPHYFPASNSGQHGENHHPDIAGKVAKHLKGKFGSENLNSKGFPERDDHAGNRESINTGMKHGYCRFIHSDNHLIVNYDHTAPGGKEAALHVIKYHKPRLGSRIVVAHHKQEKEFTSPSAAASHISGAPSIQESTEHSNENLASILQKHGGQYGSPDEKVKHLSPTVSLHSKKEWGNHRFVKHDGNGTPLSAVQVVSKKKGTGHVSTAYTHPEHRRKGYAAELIKHARKHFPNLTYSEHRSGDGNAFVQGVNS